MQALCAIALRSPAPFTFAGSFLFMGLLSIAMILPLTPVRFPVATAAEVSGERRPLAEILRQPMTIAALMKNTLESCQRRG